jgi:AcrR family transcriptional regulator
VPYNRVVVDQIPLRERRRLETSAAIVAAAHELFVRQGYDATTMDDVADAAVVSRRTLFRYFPTKEDLVFSDEDGMLGVVTDALATAPPDLTPFAAAQWACRALARYLEPRREELLTVNSLVESAATLKTRQTTKFARWHVELCGAVANRGAAHDDADLIARVSVACFQSALDRWYADDSQSLQHRVTTTFRRLSRVSQT